MSYMPRSVLAAVPAGDRPAARASTKYMETFQLVKPALGGTDLTTYPNVSGNLDIYTIGTNDEVYRLRRGTDAAAPYHDTDLNIKGRQLFLYTTTSKGSDTPNIITLGENGQLKLAVYQSAVDSYFQTETKPANATQTIREFKGVRGITGNIYVNVILAGPDPNVGLLANNFFKPGTTTWAGPAWAPIMGPDKAQAEVKAIAMVENNPVQSAICAIGKNDDVLFSETGDRTSVLRVLGYKKATYLSVVADQNDRLNIFAIEKDTGKLLLKKEKKYQSGSIKQFDDWIDVDPTQTVKLKSIYASQRFDDLLQVFGIADDGRLWHVGQVPGATKKADPTWLTLFPLGNEIPTNPDSQATLFTVGRDLDGYAEAYTVSAVGALNRFWQSPTSQQWFEERIELFQTDDKMVPVQTHALELIVLDNEGMPQPFAKVSIQASFLVTLFVNGRSYRCSQLNRVAATCGPNGKVVVYQKANALAAATLYVETTATLAGSPLVVEPNLQLQEKLETLTVNDIKNAKDAAGNYLLPAEYRTNDEFAKSLQEITQASMKIASEGGTKAAAKVNYLYVSRGRATAGFSPKLNLMALEGTAWAIDFTSGFPQYQNMTLAEVAEWKSARLAEMGPDVKGFLGIDWGNVWNSIKHAAEWVWNGLKKIVVEIVNGIGRVLFYIGEKVFEALIEFAQQAFDFVEGVWNWLKVKLKQLFEWLAFLFNIGDFVRSADAVRHSIDVLLDFTVAGVESVKQTILSGIDTVKKDLQSTVDAFLEDLNKQDNPNYNQFSSQKEMTDDQAYQMEHNLFVNAYEQNAPNASEKGSNTVSLMSSTALSGSLDTLLKMMEDLANNFQFGDGKAAFQEAVGYFTAIGDNPNKALDLLMSGVVKVMESVALFALDAARGVIATLMDLIKVVVENFKQALFAEWEIPVLSQLYKFFTGKTLSIRIVDIAAYLVAIPATLIYKLATNEAPFPDQAALDAYKNYVTVDWLKSKLGIPTAQPVAADVSIETWIAKISLGVYAAGMVVRILTDSLTGFLSATTPPAAPPEEQQPLIPGEEVRDWKATAKKFAGLAAVLMRYVTTFASCPWLINPKMRAPTCPAGTPGFGGVIWICQLVFGPTRGLLVLLLPAGKVRVYTGELTLTLWGWVQFTMVVWNYCATPNHTTVSKLDLARALCNIIPGQGVRCLFVPDIQRAYFIPAIVGEVMIVVGYLGSAGVAIAELVEIKG